MSIDREAEIQAILAGPEFMDCPAAGGARIRRAVCVERQTKGIRPGSVWGERRIPYSCQDCDAGRAVMEAFREGGDEGMGKDFRVSMHLPPETDPVEPPPGQVVSRSRLRQVVTPAGMFVDFTGSEDLLERFKEEAAKAKETPGAHVRWLIGVYVKGLERSTRDAATKL